MGFLKKYFNAPLGESLPETAVDIIPALSPKPKVADAVIQDRQPITFAQSKPDERIQAIEAEAYRLGWSPEQLWNVSKRPDQKGLICYLKPDQTIILVTGQFIEIQRSAPTGRLEYQRFYNRHAELPWIKKEAEIDRSNCVNSSS